MIANTQIRNWLFHIAGKGDPLPDPPYISSIGSLDQNKHAKLFLDLFNHKEIKSYIGFVDVIGFSARVKGWSPIKIKDYMKPFLDQFIKIIVTENGLVDKTIGDEIMFVMPDLSEMGGGSTMVPPMLKIMESIYELSFRSGPEYPIRIGLSYGSQYLDVVGSAGYEELALFGESVILAKRLQQFSKDIVHGQVCGAFGGLSSEFSMVDLGQLRLAVANPTSKIISRVISEPSIEGLPPFIGDTFSPKVKPKLSVRVN